MKQPKPIGKPRILIPPRFNKTMFSQTFQHPKTEEEYEFISFGFVKPFSVVIIFPITKKNEVVAIRQYRHGSRSVFIELPGGQKNPNESAKNAAQKELLEETGHCSEELYALNLKPLVFEMDNLPVLYDAILATDCKKIRELNLEETEYAETVLVPLPQWQRMIFDGEIVDSKSIVVTHLAFPFLFPH